MSLSETILENERNGLKSKNSSLIQLKLKELVFTYPSEVTQVLQKTDVSVKSELPPSVILAVLIKHIDKNSILRDAVAKMLLEMDGYYNVAGWVAIASGALSAVSSILSGINQGKSQTNNQQEEIERQRLALEQEKAEEAARRRRNGWMIVGSVVVLIAITLLTIRLIKGKSKVQTEFVPV